MEEQKRGRGRPKKEISLAVVEEMAAEFCSQEEIASDVGFSRELFRTRKDIREAYERGMQGGRTRLRSYQFQAAKSGNVTMLIWLGKQYLGQKDQPEAGKGDGQLQLEVVIDGREDD